MADMFGRGFDSRQLHFSETHHSHDGFFYDPRPQIRHLISDQFLLSPPDASTMRPFA